MILVSRPAAPLVAAVLLVAAVGACTTAPGASSPPSAAASVAAPAGSLPATASGGTASGGTASAATPAAASGASQTTIEWGRIWDALPPGFPVYPGAQATETGAGPATATLQVPATPEVAAAWFRTALEGAGFRIEAVNGPLEDGSIVIDAEGDAGCRAQASIAPLGSATVATIFLAADCPFR